MRNVIILGSGRSGTSMVAGCLAKNPYYMGVDFYPPRPANPKGFFESPEINSVNEHLLSKMLPRAGYGTRWACEIPYGSMGRFPASGTNKIRELTRKNPFCYKDPRFCYTLSMWQPYLLDTVMICVFRHPSVTARSIVKECQTEPYLKDVRMTEEKAINVWFAMYSHVIYKQRFWGDWIFVHYDQVVNKESLDKIEKFTGAKVDKTFPEKSIAKEYKIKQVTREAEKLYIRLCKEAHV